MGSRSANRELIILERRGPVAVITLNRPARHNSLTPTMLEELLAVLGEVRADQDMRAGVLQAAGSSFSTGGDVGGFLQHRDHLAEYAQALVGLLNQAIMTLVGFSIPVVGAVHGIVTGGSLGLVLGCDIVLMAPEASLTPYYSLVGFSPDGGWTAMLPSIIGLKRASDVLMRNLTISAEQAVSWGLASRIVPADDLRIAALEMARELADRPTGSVRPMKQLLMAPRELARRLEAERAKFVEQITSEEALKGMMAFVGGRSR
jgi:enoyl-CoA hydratase/carnithine racemase